MDTSELCRKVTVDLINAGEFISIREASDSLNQHLAPIPNPKDPNYIYGFTFGLNKFRQFIYQIDMYNSGQVREDAKIYGIRIYYGKCKRKDPEYGTDSYPDLILMPVLKDGSDLYKISDDDFLDVPVNILSQSRPCPNQCAFITLS